MQNQTKEPIATDWQLHIEGWKRSGLFCASVGSVRLATYGL